MRTAFLLASLVVSVTSALLLAAPAASALEDLSPALPEETAIYARCAGLEALLAEIGGSKLLTDGAHVRGALEAMLAQAWPALQSETGIPVEKWKDLVGSIKGAHAALFGVGQRGSDLDMVFAVETAKPDLAAEILEALFGERSTFAGEVGGARVMSVPLEEDVSLYYAVRGGLVAGAFRADRITAFLKALEAAPERSLATSAAYRAAALPAGPETAFALYADGKHGLDMFRQTLGEYDARDYEEMNRVLQFDLMQAGSVVAGGGLTRARVLMDEGHRFATALRGSPGPLALSAFAPEDTMLMLVDSGPVEKKAVAMKTVLSDQEFLGRDAEQFGKGMAEAEGALGFGFLELAAALGNEWALLWPLDADTGRIDEDNLVFAFQIGDREKFDAIFAKFSAGEAYKEMVGEQGALVREPYAGVEILRPPVDETEVPCMAVVENTLLLAADLPSLKAVIDAKASGRTMLARAGGFLAGMPATACKMAALQVMPVLMEEREFVPLLDAVAPGAAWVLALDEAPGRLEATMNQSLPALFGMLLAGEALMEETRDARQQCLANLRAIHEAVGRYRAEHGEDPASLEALVSEAFPKARLVCPCEAGEGVTCSYHLAPPPAGEEAGEWVLLAWCGNRRHGRLAVRRGGDAWEMSEQSFLRDLAEVGLRGR